MALATAASFPIFQGDSQTDPFLRIRRIPDPLLSFRPKEELQIKNGSVEVQKNIVFIEPTRGLTGNLKLKVEII